MLHIILPTCVENADMLRDMLASLHQHTEPCHLVVVVNCREDHRRAAVPPMINCLRDNGWRVRLVEEQERIGFVRACNLGWRALDAAETDLLAVLNDDLVFKGRWVAPLARQIGRGAALVGPSLQRVGADGTWGEESDPPYIEGWCLMMRAWDHSSYYSRERGYLCPPWTLFDPQFEPQLCEDMDLSLRIGSRFGPQRIQQVEIPVEHVRSVTVGTGPVREPYWSENRRKLIAKWNLGKTAGQTHEIRPATDEELREVVQCPPARMTGTLVQPPSPRSPFMPQRAPDTADVPPEMLSPPSAVTGIADLAQRAQQQGWEIVP